jgi:hypothetical protein
MPSFEQSAFPTVDAVMQLARSIVNDTFPGIAGQQGRILSNDAPFTLPYLNSSFRTLQRKLRIEGVTFPIKDNVILTNLTPVVTPDPSVQVFVGYNGYFDGTTMHAAPALPSDLLQPYVVWEQTAGTNVSFTMMKQPQEGLPSFFQGSWLGMWEWRNYAIYMPGSILAKNLRLRYKSGQPPLNIPAAQFAATAINILDCEDALANMIAYKYGNARGASAEQLKIVSDAADDAIADMANEYIRRAQTIQYRRQAYNNAGSNEGESGMIGGTERPG